MHYVKNLLAWLSASSPRHACWQRSAKRYDRGLPVTKYLLCAVRPRQKSAEVSWVRWKGVDQLWSVARFTHFCFNFFFPPMRLSSLGASYLFLPFLFLSVSHTLGDAHLLKPLRAALLPILSQNYFGFLTYCLIFAWMPLDLYSLLFALHLCSVSYSIYSLQFQLCLNTFCTLLTSVNVRECQR